MIAGAVRRRAARAEARRAPPGCRRPCRSGASAATPAAPAATIGRGGRALQALGDEFRSRRNWTGEGPRQVARATLRLSMETPLALQGCVLVPPVATAASIEVQSALIGAPRLIATTAGAAPPRHRRRDGWTQADDLAGSWPLPADHQEILGCSSWIAVAIRLGAIADSRAPGAADE